MAGRGRFVLWTVVVAVVSTVVQVAAYVLIPPTSFYGNKAKFVILVGFCVTFIVSAYHCYEEIRSWGRVERLCVACVCGFLVALVAFTAWGIIIFNTLGT